MKKAIPWILGVLLVVSNLAWLVWTIDTSITRAYDGSHEIKQSQQEQARLLKVLLKDKSKTEVLSWLKQAGYSEPFEKDGCMFADSLVLKFSQDNKVLWLASLANFEEQDLHCTPSDGLVTKYYSGMTFSKYNHPAKLYDEIDLSKVNEIRKSKEVASYYVGIYKNEKLIKLEKYINDQKTFEFVYEYDEEGKLLEVNKD